MRVWAECFPSSSGLYFIDYELGFTVLVSLSLLHVVLEFPLNVMTVRDLARRCVGGAGITVATTGGSTR